jgi:hypothetical protein
MVRSGRHHTGDSQADALIRLFGLHGLNVSPDEQSEIVSVTGAMLGNTSRDAERSTLVEKAELLGEV